MSELLTPEAVSAFFEVIFIDLVLAGDNAIVIGLAASGLPREQRNKAIFVGILAATVLRIVFASIATWLLAIVGLLVAGGILLLWVCWKMWRELRTTESESNAAEEALADRDLDGSDEIAEGAPRKTFAQAAWQIIIADVSMSLDNVLAVAGAAREQPVVLVFGLLLSIALMGAAASFIAGLLRRHRWIAYVGLAIILYVALRMIWDGIFEIHEAVALAMPWWTLLLELEILVELAAAVVAETEAVVTVVRRAAPGRRCREACSILPVSPEPVQLRVNTGVLTDDNYLHIFLLAPHRRFSTPRGIVVLFDHRHRHEALALRDHTTSPNQPRRAIHFTTSTTGTMEEANAIVSSQSRAEKSKVPNAR